MSDHPGQPGQPGQPGGPAEPGRRPEPERSHDDRDPDEPTRPLGWAGAPPSPGWGPPDARPQGHDSASHDSHDSAGYAAPQPPPQGWVPYGVPVVDHPRANLAMVLGIVGLVSGLGCGIGFLLSPVAWALGRSSVREIRASGGHYGGEGQARSGQVLGIVGTVLLALGLLAIVGFVLFLVLVAGGGDAGYTNV